MSDKFFTTTSKSYYHKPMLTLEEATAKASGEALRSGETVYIMQAVSKVSVPKVEGAIVEEVK